MSNLVSYNQFDYRPFQVAPPLNSNHPVQPPIQQPNPVAQQQLQLQPTVRSTQPSPRPGEYGQNTNSAPYAGLSYPPPPPSFDWVVPAITSLLHSQHAATFAKLNEASEQQINLASKVEALQTTTNALQQTVNAVLENLQQVSDTVAKLGADMSSRDATLAERLSALDDAIEAWPTDVRLNGPTSGPPPDGEPQPSHASDESPAQSRPHPLGQGTVEQDQQLHPLKDLIRDASPLEDSATSKQPDSGHVLGSDIPEAAPSQPPIQPIAGSSELLVRSNTKASKAPGTDQPRKSTVSSQATPTTVRRSRRKSKKRQRDDGTTGVSISQKKAKIVPKTEAGASGKVPRKSGQSRFNWESVPIQDEELEQLIYCDKCDRAYHWGCVNILPDDPILQQEGVWFCPPCDFEDRDRNASGSVHDPNTKCRPDCPVRDNGSIMFAIDAVIGRFPHSADPSGVMMQYLVKWEDYTVQQCTWTPENEIGQAARALIHDFEKAALKENLDINDRSQLILLKEARDGGWGYYTFPS
ncbi:hypothetical protein RSOLAG1IB_02211 [Rhizoctonia solani AG-1 IB]|uniref:Chromo domain-containing protein n=1 Tax=Thanatephorus cucumeris (strain AG1-IB / isolate 7/3/14) TaxID=1108050 RepID=A0A0B7FHK3_THACB|nr:hypothetical protein RSOLAG1IB_02211 [Rhizoctonia solani AG-1 IB]